MPRGHRLALCSGAQGISQGLSQGKVGKELERRSLFLVAKIHSIQWKSVASLWGGGDIRSKGGGLTQLPAVQFAHCLNGQKAVYPGW